MALTAEQLALRAGKITASFVPALCANNQERILQTWRELIGDAAYVPEDFSNNWLMHVGSEMERVMLDWHARRTGHELARRGEVVVAPQRAFLCCTLDAFRAVDRTVIDCKWVNGHRDLEEARQYYTPQMVVQRYCTGAERAVLLISHGGNEPSEHDIFITAEYEAEILRVIDIFWNCVVTRELPVPMPLPPPPPERWRKINLDGDGASVNWAAEMREQMTAWLGTTEAAKRNATAAADIKRILPDDCGECRGGGVLISRNRARAVSIKPLER